MNEASCIGMQLCHVAVDSGNHLVSVAGYQSGTIEVFWLQDNGFIGDKVFEDVWKHDSGVCAHAHCTAFHPEMPILLACDLSGWIYGYEVSGKGTISRKFEFALNGYDPRHVLFSKHDRTLCHIICEASNTLLTLRLSEDGAEIIRAVGCCPEDENSFLAAGGIKSNSPGNMLVVSERSLDVSAASNKIVTMQVVDDIPELYDISDISGRFPRDLKVLENNMIAAACQLSDRIILYRWIDGQMKQLAECRVPKVSCLL